MTSPTVSVVEVFALIRGQDYRINFFHSNISSSSHSTYTGLDEIANLFFLYL